MSANRVDPIYKELINYILRFGVEKQSRNGKIKSIFGFQFRHHMRLGFPLLTTKEMNFKSIATELIWFLRGDTNIKFLIENGCNIWNGDAYKFYVGEMEKRKKDAEQKISEGCTPCIEILNDIEILSKKDFAKKIVSDDAFAQVWGVLGPIYGHQWRKWDLTILDDIQSLFERQLNHDVLENRYPIGAMNRKYAIEEVKRAYPKQDQIINLLTELKDNPDSRRLLVSAWNVHDLTQMILPPCHHSFQVYTRELSPMERMHALLGDDGIIKSDPKTLDQIWLDEHNAPKRTISLMWNQRSADVPLGLPYNIASYGLLLVILGHIMNMVPGELIGNLGDCHIYENQINAVIEQMDREEFLLPNLKVNDSSWYSNTLDYNNIIQNIQIDDFFLKDYYHHPKIKIPLSN